MIINFKLNGENRSIDVKSNEILLDVLRNRLGIKSPKYGCGRGDCGTCTILLDGKSVRSCLILAAEVDGSEITTVEGLSKNGITPLQQAFVDNNSFQCGFCAPGMVITSTELLQNNPNPNEEQIKEAIGGNLCRCTGYVQIIEAISSVAKKKKTNSKSNSKKRRLK